MHSEHDDTESSELELSGEEGVAGALSETPSLDASKDDGETTEVDEGELPALQEDDEDEDEEDVILNAAMLELGSVSDDDEASVEFTDGGSSEGATESKTDDQSEAEVIDKTDTESK